MKVLFAITHLGFLRNFESTLALLAERGHTIHLVSDRAAQDGVTDGRPIVERLSARFPGVFTTETIRASKQDPWYAVSTAVREGLNYWRYLSPTFDVAEHGRQRANAGARAQKRKLGQPDDRRRCLRAATRTQLRGIVERG